MEPYQQLYSNVYYSYTYDCQSGFRNKVDNLSTTNVYIVLCFLQ